MYIHSSCMCLCDLMPGQQVLKLYYTLTLQEFRSEDLAPDQVDTGSEAAAEVGSDVVSE